MNDSNTVWMTSIHVNEVRNLKDFDINICPSGEMRHLILTGPNGSGKTSLLKALLSHLVALTEGSLRRSVGVNPIYSADNRIPLLFAQKQFVISYYGDFRKSEFVAPVNPEKPNLTYKIRDSKVKEFLKFLVDLKVQQALARNEGNADEAATIEQWFDTFVGILRRLFHDAALELNFNYRDYSFLINTQGKVFPFTGLSAGYSAALDIVADLILKMQAQNRFVRVFDMPGIVLIDEIETHLHLALQKEILPLLTSIFPRIQFIVTTHSPFILNSVKNTTIFDLVAKEPVQDLTEYSYEALTEGFFGVETESGELKCRLDRMEAILKTGVTDSSRIELNALMKDFAAIPDSLAPTQKARFNAIRQSYLAGGASA